MIARFMVDFGEPSALFDLLLIGLLMVRRSMPGDVFRTAWFLESVLLELMVTFALRSRLPLVRSRPGGWLLWSSVAAGVAIDNARLYAESQNRQLWLRASAEITSRVRS